MDKNTVFAFILIGLILILWPVYQRKVVGVPERPAVLESVETEDSEPSGQPPVTPVENHAPILRDTEPLRPESMAITTVDTLVFENTNIRGSISTLGGSVVSWVLKPYDRVQKDKLTGKDEKVPVDLIPEGHGLGNTSVILLLPDGTSYDLSGTVFNVVSESSEAIVLGADLPNGGRLTKTFEIQPEGWDVRIHMNYMDARGWTGNEAYRIQWNTGLAPSEKNPKEEDTYYQAFAYQGEEMVKEKKGSTGFSEGSTDWVALRTKYFVMAMVPLGQDARAMKLENREDPIVVTDYDGEEYKWRNYTLRLELASTENGASYSLYMGPLLVDQLKQYDVSLEKTMDWGWLVIRPFSIGFFHALNWLGDRVNSYGLSIIILAVLIKVALYPLTRKSYQSMRGMQELQPKIAALKQQYGKDPQRLNQETMKLYKQHGVNPMGGCLPIVLQMPVLFALFRVFRSTILFRQASFGPIADLSAPDGLLPIGGMHIHILPILLGALMIIQQKKQATVSSTDPNQKMMMYFMPVFMSFIFYQISSGLNFYYLIFNVLTIAQEAWIRRHKSHQTEE